MSTPSSSMPRIIFFSDFDGTITTKDSNDYLVAKLGYGDRLLNQSNRAVLEGKMPLRDAILEQMHSLEISMAQCIDFQCKHIELDPHFVTFYNWAKASNIPVIILSGGLRPLILALLTKLLGSEEVSRIELISNDIEFTGDENKEGGDQRKWKVKFHDGSDLGCDKAVQIEKYTAKYRGLTDAERPALLFAGDGITDICAASSCDLLFAKAGKDLVTHCENENIAFKTFEDWREIFHITKSIFEDEFPVHAAKTCNQSGHVVEKI